MFLWWTALAPALALAAVLSAHPASAPRIDASRVAPSGPLPRANTSLRPGKRPEPVLVDAARHRVYIGTETGGSVVVVNDRLQRIVRTIPVGREVEDLALDSGSHRLYAVSSVRARLSIIDTNTFRIVAVINHLKSADGVALDAARHRAYVSMARGVAVVSTATPRLEKVLQVNGGPLSIGVDTVMRRVFVGLSASPRLAVLDERSDRLFRMVRVGVHPLHPIRVDVRSHRLYVVNSGSSTLSVVDTRSLRTLRTVPTGRNPEGLDVEPGRNRIYVSNEGDPGTDKNSGHTASVIELSSGRVIDTVRTLQGPDGIAYDSNNGDLYVCQEDQGRALIVRLPVRDR